MKKQKHNSRQFFRNPFRTKIRRFGILVVVLIFGLLTGKQYMGAGEIESFPANVLEEEQSGQFFSEEIGTIDPAYKYAWSENIGWINFGMVNGSVEVSDNGLSGHAWSGIYGWINLNPTNSGVRNDGEGNLWGSAWGENTGYIDFSGVTIDEWGEFRGYANGPVTGQISLNCRNSMSCGSSDFRVITDWRPASHRSDTGPKTGGGGDSGSGSGSGSSSSSDSGSDDSKNPQSLLSILSEIISDTTESLNISGGNTGEVVSDETLPEQTSKIPKFTDIIGHWAEKYITKLYGLGIISGRTESEFAPDELITRAELTKMALLMNGLMPDRTIASPFPDVQKPHWATSYIATAAKESIVNGYSDGKFYPDKTVSRSEALKILLLSGYLEVGDELTEQFSDVPSFAWYNRFIRYGFDRGVVGGYGNGLFQPDAALTRAEATKMAVKILELRIEESKKNEESGEN